MLNAQEIKIAIIDDDEDDYFIIADYIKGIEGSNFIIDWCNNYQQAIQKINEPAGEESRSHHAARWRSPIRRRFRLPHAAPRLDQGRSPCPEGH